MIDLSNGAIFSDLEQLLTHAVFKVTLFFDAEYLRNGTTYRYRILIGTYICPTVSFRMTLSDLAKYSMRRSTRGLFATAELLVS